MTADETPDRSPAFLGVASALLPDTGDEALWTLAETVFIDSDVEVAVSPVDQLLVAFARRLLSDPVLGCHGLVQLPRCAHRSAVMLAILSHLLCRQKPARLQGPVVLIGLDIDLTQQLRTLAVRNRRRMGLAEGNPLSVHRLTRSGEVVPLIGSRQTSPDRALIYFNSRVGEPALLCSPPLVVLDGLTVKNPAARARALRWALALGPASIVAVGDLGDSGFLESMTNEGVVPSVLSLTPEVVRELIYNLGAGSRSLSSLSSAQILAVPTTTVRLHRVGDVELNGAVSRAVGALAGKPEDVLPVELSLPLRMLRNGIRLAADVSAYRSACVENPRPGEMPDVRRLDRLDPQLPPRWRRWQQDRLPDLILGVRTLWRSLEESNPKVKALWSVLDELARTTSGTIAIRCHSRAAARATFATLTSDERTAIQCDVWEAIRERVKVVTLKERFRAGSLDAQVVTGAPPPWDFAMFCGVEAKETHVLCFETEAGTLTRFSDQYAKATAGWGTALRRSLGVPSPAFVQSPITVEEETSSWRTRTAPSAPGLTLTAVLDQASAALDPAGEADESISAGSGTARLCVPVKLSDGRTWWCVDEGHGDTPVVVVTAGGHEIRAVKSLRFGERVLVPAGEGTESIHARLVAASRTNTDVSGLDTILGQFRSAARAVLTSSATQAEAIGRVQQAGAQASGQLIHWATGSTIAPHDPDDMAAVFAAAGRPCPDLRFLYSVANALRQLNRWLGVTVAAIRSGHQSDLEELRKVVGNVADEIRDEFVVVQVESVGDPRDVPGSFVGRIR